MRFRSLVPFATALALSVTACGGDGGTGPQVELNNTEIAQLLDGLSAFLGASSLPFFRASGPGPSFSVVGIGGRPPVNESLNCPSGGTVGFSGSYSETTTSFSFNITSAFNSCRFDVFQVGGSLTIQGSGSSTQTTFSLNMTIRGTLTISASNNRSGSCTFNLTVVASTTSASVTGTVCGQNVSGIF